MARNRDYGSDVFHYLKNGQRLRVQTVRSIRPAPGQSSAAFIADMERYIRLIYQTMEVKLVQLQTVIEDGEITWGYITVFHQVARVVTAPRLGAELPESFPSFPPRTRGTRGSGSKRAA